MPPADGAPQRPARRALGLAGWGLFIGALVVLWRDPTLLQRLRHGELHPPSPDACELATGQPCIARFDDGLELSLQVTPAGFMPGTDATWTIQASDPQVQVTGLELTGVSMPMGLTTLAVQPAGPGQWLAQGRLPLCTVTQMEWRADVLLEGAGRERVAAFQFWTTGQAPPPVEAVPGRGAGAPDAPAPTYGDFTVQTAQGPLSLADLRGKLVLLYFGYTACPDVCPTTLLTLGAALRLLDAAEQEQVVGLMVSLDPGRDGLERLHTYTSHFHPAFRGGTTDDASLDRITADWGVSWRVVPLGGSAMSYAVDHATYSILIGPDGAVHGRIEHGTSPEEVALRLRQVLAGAAAEPSPGG